MRLTFILIPVLAFCGCAAEKAVDGAIDVARATTTALIEKSQLQTFQLGANGKITNPHYRVWVVFVQGIYTDIGVDGVEVGGTLQGAGTGTNKEISDETLEAILELLKSKAPQ